MCSRWWLHSRRDAIVSNILFLYVDYREMEILPRGMTRGDLGLPLRIRSRSIMKIGHATSYGRAKRLARATCFYSMAVESYVGSCKFPRAAQQFSATGSWGGEGRDNW